MKPLVEFLLASAGLYLGLGALFAAAFHWRGLARIDSAAAGAGLGFRLLITPGVIALWPLMALRWWQLGQGRTWLGEPESPVSPRRLRGLHRVFWQGLVTSVPLLIAAALWWRPEPPASAPDLPVMAHPNGAPPR